MILSIAAGKNSTNTEDIKTRMEIIIQKYEILFLYANLFFDKAKYSTIGNKEYY